LKQCNFVTFRYLLTNLRRTLLNNIDYYYLNNMQCVCQQIISFDELKTDYKNPIDQCNSLNPVSGFTVVAVRV